MEVGIEAACWVVGKALSPVSGGVLEAWAASTELGQNIRDLRMELLYAQGMLNNARGRGRDQELQNPALTELLQELRDLGYRAHDVLDEVDYFRIQDDLDGSYHAADEHEGGCLRNHALNARHTARAMANLLCGFSKCSPRSDNHNELVRDENERGGTCRCGAWPPCLGLATPSDDDEEDEDARHRGATCGALWPCRTSVVPPDNQQSDQEEINHGCMGHLASGARNTINAVGKHLPCCHSVTPHQNNSDSNIAPSNERQRWFLCCARPSNKAPQREPVVQQTPKQKFNRVEMSRTMKEIVEQLKPVCAKVSTILNLELLDSNRSVAQWIATSLDGRISNKQWHTPIPKIAKSRPVTTSEFIDPEFYGRRDKTSKIVHDITNGEYCDKALTVLPIVGPGGIGKTTLTQYIYNDKELQQHFEDKLWVCVSVNFNVYRLAQEIADKLSNERKDNPDKLIEERLKSKKFLLVLDDIWDCSDEDEWKRFLLPFTKVQTKGNVILVTTRFPAVAQIVKTVDSHIDLGGLDQEAFKQFFLACAFGEKKTENNHSELRHTGDMIMEKLKGSPLAAKTVGRLLRNNLDLYHWTRVLESREWESQQGDHDIMPALKLSFDYLPFHLQQCFTYCALFPEDYRFGREELVHFWIGLDALHSDNENASIEDIGVNYLNELVNHGFFKREKEYRRIRYVIHDLLHELALKVSSHECLSIYSSTLSSTQIFPSVRHLSINIDDSSFKDRVTFDDCRKDFSALDKKLKVENLYSLMLFGTYQDSFVRTFSGLFSKAKSLRVIYLSEGNYSMKDLFPNYLNLFHIRYLRISGVLGSRLSSTISRYYHLRVLHLHGRYYEHHDLSRDMGNLIKLRHFLVHDYTMHSSIPKVGNLKALQALEVFMVKKERQGFELKQIGQLPELHGSFNINNLEKVESREEAEEAKLMRKKHLHELLLDWDIGRSNKDPTCEGQVLEGLKPHINLLKLRIKGHRGVKCPSWLGVNLSVKNLESLCLDNVAWKAFPPIGKLWIVNEELSSGVPNQNFHNLKTIELANLEGVRKWVVDSTCLFYSCLEVLIIRGCNELMELSFSNSTCGRQEQNTCWFPKLSLLRVYECPKLSSLPPVPWTRAPCVITMSNVGLGFEELDYENRGVKKSLRLVGRGGAHGDDLWSALNFDNLTELNHLNMNKCPPLPLDRLRKLSCIKQFEVLDSDSDKVICMVEEDTDVQIQLPVETIYISSLGASGKELTKLLSYMSNILNFTMLQCDKVTRLTVAEQQQLRTTCSLNKAGAETSHVDLRTKEEKEEGLLVLPSHLRDLDIYCCPVVLCAHPDDSPVGLQGLCSLRSLRIWGCREFFSSYLSASSTSLVLPFPTFLQELSLEDVDLAGVSGRMVSLSHLVSLTDLSIFGCGDLRGGVCLPQACLTRLSVSHTSNVSFLPQNDGRSSPSFSALQSLDLNSAAGVLAPRICSLLSSSLTSLSLYGYDDMEGFTEQEEEALQLLTALQELHLSFKNLQRLPAAGLRGLPSLKRLRIVSCDAIRSLPKNGLPNSLEKLEIVRCSAIRSLPKDVLPDFLQQLEIYKCPSIRTLGLPCSLQELGITRCPSIRTLPKAGLPRSLRLLDVERCQSEELKSHCRKLIGIIPIVKV